MASKYEEATDLGKADMHIMDARGSANSAAQNMMSALGDLQTAHGLSNNNLGARLKADDIIAVAQVKATMALVQATLAVAHSNIGLYLFSKGSIVFTEVNSKPILDDEVIACLDGYMRESGGSPGSEEVSQEPSEATE